MSVFAFLAVMLQFSVAVEQFFINDNLDSLYSTYNLIEDTIKGDPKLHFKIKKAFFPAMNYRYWQLDGAEVIPIQVCVTFNKLPPLIQCDGTVNMFDEQHLDACWTFLWTNSLLMNLIPGDTLLVMDVILTTLIYSDIVESRRNRELSLSVQLNGSLLPCQPSSDQLEQTFALFFSSVSIISTEVLNAQRKCGIMLVRLMVDLGCECCLVSIFVMR